MSDKLPAVYHLLFGGVYTQLNSPYFANPDNSILFTVQDVKLLPDYTSTNLLLIQNCTQYNFICFSLLVALSKVCIIY